MLIRRCITVIINDKFRKKCLRKLNTGLREFNTPIYDTKKKELRHRRKVEEM